MTAEHLRRKLTTSLHITGRQWRKTVDLKLIPHSLSEASAGVLIGIARLGDGVRQLDLAHYLGIEGPSLVRLVDRLEMRGLITRRDDPDDRRAKNLWLTEEGRTVASRIETELDVIRSEVLGRLDISDIEAALRVFAAFENI